MSWGPAHWVFFHSLAANITEEGFSLIGKELISFIRQICANLPCPECSDHSKIFWTGVKLPLIKNKFNLIHLLFIFHNKINERKKKLLFDFKNMLRYHQIPVAYSFNMFASKFLTTNEKLMSENLHRRFILKNFSQWMKKNIFYFSVGIPKSLSQPTSSFPEIDTKEKKNKIFHEPKLDSAFVQEKAETINQMISSFEEDQIPLPEILSLQEEMQAEFVQKEPESAQEEEAEVEQVEAEVEQVEAEVVQEEAEVVQEEAEIVQEEAEIVQEKAEIVQPSIDSDVIEVPQKDVIEVPQKDVIEVPQKDVIEVPQKDLKYLTSEIKKPTTTRKKKIENIFEMLENPKVLSKETTKKKKKSNISELTV